MFDSAHDKGVESPAEVESLAEISVEDKTASAPWRWKPGQSANPGGKKKKAPVVPTREEILDELFHDKKITVARVAALKACLDEVSTRNKDKKGNTLDSVSDDDLRRVVSLLRPTG
jgi:hypothetical protein